MGLIARGLEEQGMPTVYIGSCRDMMALVKPPRAVFVDFPLGHQCGKPNDAALQRRILQDALEALVKLSNSGQMIDLSYQWGEPFDWKSYWQGVEDMIREEKLPPKDWVPKK